MGNFNLYQRWYNVGYLLLKFYRLLSFPFVPDAKK